MSEAGLPREVTAAAVAATDATLDPGRTAGITAIWIRELRGRMRGKRAFIFLTFYLSLLGGILWLALRSTEDMGGLTATQAMGLGRGVFGGVLLIETLVVIALAPAYTPARSRRSASQKPERPPLWASQPRAASGTRTITDR